MRIYMLNKLLKFICIETTLIKRSVIAHFEITLLTIIDNL